MTPFQALYGYEPPKWKDLALQMNLPAVKNQLEETQKIIQTLKENLNNARNLVLETKRKNKLALKFYGPYQINKKISQVAYSLNLLEKSRVHNVFHVSCLKRALGDHQSSQTTLPSLDDEERVILEPKGIITTRERKLRSRVIKDYLIKWKDLAEEEASWGTEAFRQQHPSLRML
eukprot:PITA_27271